jgi:lysyl-tRNA synthetase class 2
MLEAYEAYGDQHTMMELAKGLVRGAHRAIGSPVVLARDGSEIDLHGEWRVAPILELVSVAVGAVVDVDTDAGTLRGYADKHDVELHDGWGAPEIVVELFEQLVEDSLVQPTFVMDYPEAVKPLAKPHRSTPGLNEAWDLIINGVELGAAYSELNDPVIQRERLEAQSRQAAQGDPEAMELDEVFLKAMEYGMPPAGGIGIGVDRLIMLLTGASVRETILFPLVRPEQG